jgi:hypothetical protein
MHCIMQSLENTLCRYGNIIKNCLPILRHSTEACPINAYAAKSFDIINRFWVKVFRSRLTSMSLRTEKIGKSYNAHM